MPDPFDAPQYLAHLRRRWRLAAIVLAAAMASALAISLLVPKRYTARVSLLIEPPAGGDPRMATAVSPIYLESLKTYEHYASSDQLFLRAAERFQLRGPGQSTPIDRLKRRVLRVTIPRSTKVLELAVTLGDPAKAYALATYLAEETMKLNRQTNRAGDEEMLADAAPELEAAGKRLAAAEAARRQASRRGPMIEAMESELGQLRERRLEVERLALSAELSAAEQQERETAPPAAGPRAPDPRVRLPLLRGRAERLRQQAQELARQIAAQQKAMAARSTEVEALEKEYESAWSRRDQWDKRIREIRGTAGSRGERLHLLDPGVIPERPSWPNLPLNLVVAGAMAALLSLFYLTVEYGLQAHQAEAARETSRAARY